MRQLQSPVTMPSPGQMLLIDDFLEEELVSDPDLYQMLMAQPVSVKKASFAYDYSPATLVVAETQILQIKNIQEERSSFSENSGGGKRCTCTKTRCQKNYCQCFKQGVTCTEQCGCFDCCNRIQLFIQISKENQSTKCKCLKSHCSKNYCECHNAGKKCGPECKCLQCQNLEDLDELFFSQPRKKQKRQFQLEYKSEKSQSDKPETQEKVPRNVMKSASF